MRPISAVFVSLSVCLPWFCLAQSKANPQPDPYANEAIIWEHLDTTVHMHADGTGDRILHVTARLQSAGAVRQFSVVSLAFASAYETGNIDYLRVHKPDGTVVETPVADAIEMPAPVTQTAPLYSDLKEKQLPVRSLATGDVIEYQFRTTRTKAEAPGQFWGADHFLREAGIVLAQTLTLEVPADKYLQVWDPNHSTTPTQHDGLRTYTWSSSQLELTPKSNDQAVKKINDPDEDADGRKLPSVAWTTFHNWEEVGNWYRSLALARSQPTPAVVSRANDLTREAKTPEDQVRALYDFVSTHIRYVGIDFGIGAIQPHAAEEVLANQYGDCKDKDTLLEALLRAKGFTTAPALIGADIAPVPDLPSPALFNHVITTVNLPSGRIWLDTTPEVAPYRVLYPAIRDEQALFVPATGAATLERTPAEPPYPYFERFEAVASLSKDGLLTSHMDMTMRSDSELGFRLLLQRAAPAQWDEAMQSVSRAMGFAGTVSNTDMKQKDPAGPMRLSYDYTRPAFADWDNHRILPLFPALEITYIDREKAPDHDIDQGAPRRLEAITRIKLPEGFTPTLPDAVHVKRDYATFDQVYRVEKGELIVERTAVILKKKVPKADWKDYYAYTKALGAESGENYITLNVPGSGHPPASEAIVKAGAEMKQGQWDAARQTLNAVRTSDPKTPYLMGMLAFLAQREGKNDEAIKDYEAELSNHPDSTTQTVIALANLYVFQKRYSDAETLLLKYVDRKEVILFVALASAQTRSGQFDAALATLQSGLAAHPDDMSIESMLPTALHKAHRDDEAVAIIKKALTSSNDANVLNTNAYLLSNIKLELPLAEASSRHSIEMLESSLAALTLQQVNDKDFGQTNLLAASWDTLGWILFQEGKAAEAEPYIRASWVNNANVIVGDHLAQVVEALGRRSEALKIDELALASEGPVAKAEESVEVKRNLERLRRAGVTSPVRDASQALQQMRTFHVGKPVGEAGSATFKLAIADDRIDESDLVNGPPELRAFSAKLNQLKVPGALPAGSKAHLFRDGILYCSSGTSACEFVLAPHQFGQPRDAH
jgi:predicted Zn-dependent protease/transglutaminase-like putative cysteine protease